MATTKNKVNAAKQSVDGLKTITKEQILTENLMNTAAMLSRTEAEYEGYRRAVRDMGTL